MLVGTSCENTRLVAEIQPPTQQAAPVGVPVVVVVDNPRETQCHVAKKCCILHHMGISWWETKEGNGWKISQEDRTRTINEAKGRVQQTEKTLREKADITGTRWLQKRMRMRVRKADRDGALRNRCGCTGQTSQKWWRRNQRKKDTPEMLLSNKVSVSRGREKGVKVNQTFFDLIVHRERVIRLHVGRNQDLSRVLQHLKIEKKKLKKP